MRTKIVVKSDKVPQDLIVLSVPDDIHTIMERHEEVRWNKVVEHEILRYIDDLVSSDRSNDMVGSSGSPRV
ncbi:MAG: hypothetical protein QF415_03875 [Candidatus Undinarchaeales archaeon]|jgi:hypothetical protein|nr:hypothetical protein [Candidatus Undinarchaeales archaeon]MDP7491372.1 hypothetical protein [Candidatus Undinarchaeales archaeon]